MIGIDPVSMAAPAAGTERSFTPDLKFLVELKLIAREFACSIILVTHPKESLGARKSPIDNLAGGKAYARFAQTIIWACRYDQPKDVRVNIGADREEMASVERYIQNVKTRNGRGAGLDIAFAFDPGTLRFTELGTICRAAANGSNRITQLETQDPFGDPAWVNGEGASENSPLADHLGARLRAPIAQQHIWFDDDKDPGDN